MVSSVFSDNAPINPAIADTVKQFNSRYGTDVTLHMVTLQELYDLIREKVKDAPVYPVSYTHLIRPEDVHDSEDWLKKSPETVIESTIRVYELLGAEVFLYFDVEGANVTARVDPRTTARTGDTVKFALDAEKIHVFDKETELVITN